MPNENWLPKKKATEKRELVLYLVVSVVTPGVVGNSLVEMQIWSTENENPRGKFTDGLITSDRSCKDL